MFVDWAERGRVPDTVVRLGIRRLLSLRRRQIALTTGHSDATDALLKATQTAPIAVASEQANQQHYELPPEFFQRVLGPHLKYSCCYWPEGVDSLAAAEVAALERTCEHAELGDGMEILELGCGWGALSLWMAEQYPGSRITAVSNSTSQRRFIQREAGRRSLGNLNVVTADMNEFHTEATFDRVVSVEMFEHMRNHRELMRRISRWLLPGGRLLVHVFCHRTTPYLYCSEGEQNWMGRHFFSGGMMPSVDLLPKCSGDLQLAGNWQWNGRHYAQTCRAWLARLDDARDELAGVLQATYGEAGAERWRRRWRMFFMACEELFAFGGGNEWFVKHFLFENGPSK